MADRIYEWKYPDGDTAKFIREPDGKVRYWLNKDWKFVVDRKTWQRLVAAMEEERPQELSAPIMTLGELIGWRVWEYEDGLLHSVYQDVAWAPDQPMTGYVGDDDDSGGVYAFRDKGHAISVLQKANSPAFLGSVALWGDVVEHENGYRAEFAKILTIDLASDPAAAAMMRAARQTYQVGGTGEECLSGKTGKKRSTGKPRLAISLVGLAFGLCGFAAGTYAYFLMPDLSRTYVVIAPLQMQPSGVVGRCAFFNNGYQACAVIP